MAAIKYNDIELASTRHKLALQAALCYNISRKYCCPRGTTNTLLGRFATYLFGRYVTMNSLSPRGYVPQELPFASEEAIPQKICKKCDNPFPATKDFFRPYGKNNNLRTECRECEKAANREYKNRPEVRKHRQEYKKSYYQNHPEYREYIKAYGKTRRESTEKREQILAHKRAYHYSPERQARLKVYQALSEVRERKLIASKRYRDKHHERRLAYMKEYYKRSEVREHRKVYQKTPKYRAYRRDYLRTYNKTYYKRSEVRERVRAREKRYRNCPEIRERYKAYSKVYRSRPEIQEFYRAYRKAYKKPYYAKKRDKILEQQKNYYNRPEIKERYRIYGREYGKRPEVRERNHIRREISRGYKNSTKGTYTIAQIQDLLKRQHYCCYYCRHKLEKKQGKYIYHIDHTFPLSRTKDTNDPINDISYLVIACPTCNLKKGNKFPHEFYEGGRLL